MPSADNGHQPGSSLGTRLCFNTHTSTRVASSKPHTYRISAYARDMRRRGKTLIDRGANGCIKGNNMRRIAPHKGSTHVHGLKNHTLRDLPLVQAGATVKSNRGPVILIVNQAAALDDDLTILAPAQLEHYKWNVHEKSPHITGETPYLESPEGYKFPLSIRHGLPYLAMRPYTDQEWKDLPHVIATSPFEWDPSCLDSSVDEEWFNQDPAPSPYFLQSDYDEFGNLKPGLHSASDDSDGDGDRPVQRSDVRAFATAHVSAELAAARSAFVSTRQQRLRRKQLLQRKQQKRQAPSAHQRAEPASFPATPSPSSSTVGEILVETVLSETDDASDGKNATEDTVPPLWHRPDESSSSSDSDSDMVPPLFRHQLDSSSDSDSDVPIGKPSFNTKAKTATGIDNPSGRWGVKSVRKRDYKRLKKFLPGASVETIKKTIEATTQYATKGAVEGTTLRQQIHAPNPVLNVPRRNEDVATDTLYSSTPAIGDGSTACQFFIGRISKYRSVTPLGNSDKDFPKALLDEIRKRGAMNRIISDRAKAEISEKVKDIFRTFVIGDWQSEPHQQRQNFAEGGWRTSKEWVNNLLNISGAPPEYWLFALMYVCFLQNHLAYKSLGWRTPTEWLLGYTPDISALLQFVFYQPVLFAAHEPSFPEDPTEHLGRFLGISENIGHGMTFVIGLDNGEIVHRARVRSALGQGPYKNLRALRGDDGEQESDTGPTPFQRSLQFDIDEPLKAASRRKNLCQDTLRSPHDGADEELPGMDIKELTGRTFITNPNEDGEQFRATVVGAHATGELTADQTDAILRFKCKHGDRLFEEVMSYNKMLEWCDKDLDKDDMFRIEGITGHRKAKMETTKGQWEVLVQWASGVSTWNCLNLTFSDDPATVSLYALRNKLLETPGWKRCKPYVKNAKRFGRMINQAKLRNYRRRPVYKYGHQVPRNHQECIFIDEKNGNTHWQESEKLEISQLNDYDTFRDLGLGAPRPDGYIKIPCHMIYDVKHDGRRKSRFVAGGHRTPTPDSSVYSGVVSLQGIRIVTLLAELNDMELWSTDVGNAYLESYTTEKVCFTAGGEFGELEGHTLVIVKALYGLKSSGKCWHDRLFEVLWDIGFRPSKAEADIWLRPAGDHYEYLAIYVDDLLISSKEPQKIIDALEGKPHQFTLKGTGPVEFHLGCDYYRDEDGTLCVGPRKYIERLAMQYKSFFGKSPNTKYRAPLEKNDHPEMDISPLLDEDGITQYQSLIGALQWTITLGRFDIAVAVMTLSSFRVAPRVGHLDRLRRIVGYLVKKRHGAVRVRTGEPDFSDLPTKRHDWSHSVYGSVKEVIPGDAPVPLGKRVVLTALVDANLHHDFVTGRSVTGVLHFINQTPIDWFAKKQATCEVATYGSEFVAARIATEQVLALRTTLRYLGVEVHGPTRLFGDNGSVVTSGSIPESPLKKRHHALSYHFTREAIASDAMDFQHIPGDVNAADVLSKHWAYAAVWPLLKSVLFWPGDTGDLFDMEERASPGPNSEDR